jgi:hypothetical protein
LHTRPQTWPCLFWSSAAFELLPIDTAVAWFALPIPNIGKVPHYGTGTPAGIPAAA